jgi:hypothetical protein
MNQTEKINLSKRVAAKYGIEDYVVYGVDDYGAALPFTWLADDSARCFELAVENNLDIVCNNSLVVEVFSLTGNFVSTVEAYADHADAKEATRIAILKCLDKMKGE